MLVSLITVTYNSRQYLPEFFASLAKLDTNGFTLEVLAIDNGSTDGSLEYSRSQPGNVRAIENTSNNYCQALNRGIALARGEYILVANNDARADHRWIRGLLDTMVTDEQIGAVQSKIVFLDGSGINSVGGKEVGPYYWADMGFREKDVGQYDQVAERQYVSGGSVLFRRSCLEDTGPFDEDLIMYFEDVDYSIRCRKRGWKLYYTPDSVFYHRFHGSASNQLCSYLCNRNRFLILAKHYPGQLAATITTSKLYRQGAHGLLLRCLAQAGRTLFLAHGRRAAPHFAAVCEAISRLFGPETALRLLARVELMLGLRRPRLALFAHLPAATPASRRYLEEIRRALTDRYDLTVLLGHHDHTPMETPACTDDGRGAIKTIAIPTAQAPGHRPPRPFQRRGLLADSNALDLVALATLEYDIFVNLTATTAINPLALRSVLLCQPPVAQPDHFFHGTRYDHLIATDPETAQQVESRWQRSPTALLPLPVDMGHPQAHPADKEPMILLPPVTGALDDGGLAFLLHAFAELVRLHPRPTTGWRLVVAQWSRASIGHRHKMDVPSPVEQTAVEMVAVTSLDELRQWLRRAAILWFGDAGISKGGKEHQGDDTTTARRTGRFRRAEEREERETTRNDHPPDHRTTVIAAMQNCSIPLVPVRGEAASVLPDGGNGFTYDSRATLIQQTVTLITNETLRHTLAAKAQQHGRAYDRSAFAAAITRFFQTIEEDITGTDRLRSPTDASPAAPLVFPRPVDPAV